RVEKLYGYLHDDVTRRRASVGLAIELAGLHPGDAAARDRLGPSGLLVQLGLVEVDDADRPLLTRALRVPDRVTAHLLGSDVPEPAVAELVVEAVEVSVDDDGGLGRLAPLLAGEDGAGPPAPGAPVPPVVYVTEPAGASGRSFAARALARAGRPSLVADLERLGRDTDPARLAAAARALVREARLRGAVLVAGPLDHLAERGPEAVRPFSELPVPVVLTGRRHWEPDWSRRVPVAVRAPVLPPGDRAQLWRARLDGQVVAGLDP